MAIKKQITADNGVVTEYHRIAIVKMDTNQQNTILVHSYISEAGRQIEKDYSEGKYKGTDEELIKCPYVDDQYICTEYNSDMAISKAYEYLKMLPQFKGAEDI